MLLEFGLQIAIAIYLWIFLDLYGKQGPRARRIPILLTVLLAACWSTGELLILDSVSAEQRAVGRRLYFLGSLFLPVAWLWTSASIARPAWFVRRPGLIALAALPQVVAYATMYVSGPPWFVDTTSPTPSHGPLFPYASALAFLTYAVGCAYSLHSTVRIAGRFDLRAAAVLTAMVVPAMATSMYLHLDAVTLDLSPVLIGGAAAALRFTLLESGYTGALPIGQESIIEQLASGVLVADLEGNVAYANPAASEMLGGGLEQRPLDEVLHDASSAADRVITHERVVLRRHGAVVGYAAVLTDRSEATKLEQQLADRQKLESLGTLAGGIAHDFNNLLAGMLENARTAREALDARSAARAPVDEVLYGGQLAAHLAGQLLSYTGKRRFQKRPVPLGELLAELEPLLRRSVGPERVFRVEVDDDASAVLGDAVEIRQVLLNLVNNAAQATRPGGRVTVRVYTPTTSETALPELLAGHRFAGFPCTAIEVSDDGEGMSEAIQAKVFDPFFSTKERGHGLGLAATLGIVHGHGGALSLRSAPGMGSRFRIFLPAAPYRAPVRSTEAPRRAPVRAHEAPVAAAGGRVLIVDDEPYLVRALETALERRGFATLSASSGEEAIELYRAHRAEIDVVLLDFKMPGLSGVETFLAMRRLDPTVAALLTSGHYKDEARTPEEIGFAGFFQKPYDLRALETSLRSIIRRRRADGSRSSASAPPPP